MLRWLKLKLLRWMLDDVHQELVLAVQEARAHADYLQGGMNDDLVVSEHILTPAEAGEGIRERLDGVLRLLGAEA